MQTTEDIYSATEILIEQLKQHPISKVAAILHHRMHKVAWTTNSELLGELYKVLTVTLSEELALFSLEERMQIEQLLNSIKNSLKDRGESRKGVGKGSVP